MSTSRATEKIDNDVERTVTFNNLHGKLFKKATELSALTGARIAVVLESENGKVYLFGTPSAESIVDNFLSGTTPFTDLGGEQNASTMQQLQSKVVVELERDLAEVKEMAKAPEKVGYDFPKVQVAPQMPPSHTSPEHSARVLFEGKSPEDIAMMLGPMYSDELNLKPAI